MWGFLSTLSFTFGKSSISHHTCSLAIHLGKYFVESSNPMQTLLPWSIFHSKAVPFSSVWLPICLKRDTWLGFQTKLQSAVFNNYWNYFFLYYKYSAVIFQCGNCRNLTNLCSLSNVLLTVLKTPSLKFVLQTISFCMCSECELKKGCWILEDVIIDCILCESNDYLDSCFTGCVRCFENVTWVLTNAY